MEIALAIMPELTFEWSYGSKYGKEGEKKEKNRLFVFFMRRRKFIVPGSLRKASVFQVTLPGDVAGFLLFVILDCELGLDSSKRFLWNGFS